jgi:hypothetical protein
MTRRVVTLLVVALGVAAPLAAQSQPAGKAWRVGVLYASVGFFLDAEPVDRAFVQGLLGDPLRRRTKVRRPARPGPRRWRGALSLPIAGARCRRSTTPACVAL